MFKKSTKFPLKAKAKWETDLNKMFTQEEFKEFYCSIYTSTSSTKFKDFQYRLLNRALVNSIELYKWKIIPSNLCTFSNEQPETAMHLLLTCEISKIIWNTFLQHLSIKTGKPIHFTEVEKMLGITQFNHQNIYNLLFIIVKQYLYACRCQKSKPQVNVLLEKSMNLNILRLLSQEKITKCKSSRRNGRWRCNTLNS